jgi:hypothetical protein
MKRESIELHGVRLSLAPDGAIEASIGGAAAAKSNSVESLLLYFLLREMQALNGLIREDRRMGHGPIRSEGIFPP